MAKLKVGILGRGGLVGRCLEARLKKHPYFEHEEELSRCTVLFSALPSSIAKKKDAAYADQGFKVFSLSDAHRLEPDVPLILPEINENHWDLIPLQQKKRGFNKGFIVAKPNCTLHSFLLPLFPLHKQFQLKKLMVTTLQSESGAGKHFSLEKNVLPYIEGEEEKSRNEPFKILGKITETGIQNAPLFSLSIHCNRVPVSVGHLACIDCSFEKKPSFEDIFKLWSNFPSLKLPSSPDPLFFYMEQKDRPQPQLDAGVDQGMRVSLGRLRPSFVLDFSFTSLSNNLERGAAGGVLLLAEQAFKKRLLN